MREAEELFERAFEMKEVNSGPTMLKGVVTLNDTSCHSKWFVFREVSIVAAVLILWHLSLIR